MVWTRSQLENISKEELIDEPISVEDMASQLSDLTSRFDDFMRQYEILFLELTVGENRNHLLSERIVQLERNSVNNVQYHRRESLQINLVALSTDDDVIESHICHMSHIFLTWWASSMSPFEEKGHCDS